MLCLRSIGYCKSKMNCYSRAFLNRRLIKEANMGYRKAEEILPMEIIEVIQQYVDGESIYIPRKNDCRKEWGANTCIKQELFGRNQRIYQDYLAGMRNVELAAKYCLSEKSIQRILREMKTQMVS